MFMFTVVKNISCFEQKNAWSRFALIGYCLNCTNFGKLILRKITKIAATICRCYILKLKCTKFDFGWGSAPDPAGGVYSAPPDPLTGFKGSTSKGRGGNGRGGQGRAWEGPGSERGGREGGWETEKGAKG